MSQEALSPVDATEQAASEASPRAHLPPLQPGQILKNANSKDGQDANVYTTPSGSALTETPQVATWPWNVPSLIRRQMPGTSCTQGASQVSLLGCGKARVTRGLHLPGLVGTDAHSRQA